MTDCDRVRPLLGEHLAGALSPEEAAALEAHVEACVSCGTELGELERLEGSLGALRHAPARTALPRTWLGLALAGAAAGLVLGLVLTSLVSPRRSFRGERLVATGRAALALPGGSAVRLEPGCALRVLGPRELRVEAGRAVFHVEPGPARFVVHTPRGDVSVLGTEFAVSVEEEAMSPGARVVAPAAVVTIAVASGVVLFRSFDASPAEVRLEPGQQAVARVGSVELTRPGDAAAAAAVTSQKAALERENAALRSEIARLRQRLLTAEQTHATPAPAAAPSAEERSPRASDAKAEPRLPVAFGKWSQVEELARTDWHEGGEAMRALGPILKDLIARRAAGKAIPSELGIQVAKENTKLQKLALAINGKVPTHSTGNGEFTHPVVLANLMAKHLEAAGAPLSDAQVGDLAALGEQFDARYRDLDARYGAETPLLEKIVDELELKKVFSDRTESVLTSQQRALLFDPAMRHVLQIDLYSPMLMVIGRAAPMPRASRDAFREPTVTSWLAKWKLDEARRRDLEVVFDRWLETVAPPDPTPGVTPYVRIDQTIAAGRATVAAIKDVLRTFAPTAEQTKALLKDGGFFVPLLSPEAAKKAEPDEDE